MDPEPHQANKRKKSRKPYTKRKTSVQSSGEVEINAEVGHRIRQARVTAQLSQSALGHLIGVTFQQVQKYERGTNRVSIATLLAVCRSLDLNPSDILAGLIPPGGEARHVRSREKPTLDALRLMSTFSRLTDRKIKLAIVRFIEAFLPPESETQPGDHE